MYERLREAWIRVEHCWGDFAQFEAEWQETESYVFEIMEDVLQTAAIDPEINPEALSRRDIFASRLQEAEATLRDVEERTYVDSIQIVCGQQQARDLLESPDVIRQDHVETFAQILVAIS